MEDKRDVANKAAQDLGYLSLGNLIVYFSKMLSHTLDASYKCHPQRTVAKNINPGQNPSTDVALILKERDDVSVKYISRVLYEYKPAVGHIIQVANIKHLLELFLQCYYVMKYEKTSRIMGCFKTARSRVGCVAGTGRPCCFAYRRMYVHVIVIFNFTCLKLQLVFLPTLPENEFKQQKDQIIG